jgi:altronate dehydratase large subunit
MMNFSGYKRVDGKIGIRNKVLIVAVDECCYGMAMAMSKGHDDVVVVVNHATCMLGGNEETLHNMIEAIKNPNVSGALVLAMGCGSITPDLITGPILDYGKTAYEITCSAKKGTKNAIDEGRRLIEKLLLEARNTQRAEATLSDLTVGIKCGGSDTSSGIASNPSVGHTADMLVDAGATVIAGELFEVLGCEDFLIDRCVNDEVKAKFLRLVDEESRRWSVEDVAVETMSVGTYAYGLSTIEEKSLGAIYKMGTRPIVDVLEFNKDGYEKPSEPGMYLSDATMLCGGAGMHFAAVGATVILWTSGSASFNNEIVPVIRVSGNEEMINEDQDIDATGIMNGTDTCEGVAKRILEKLVSVANGNKTAIEGIGYAFPTLYQKDQRLEKLLVKTSEMPCSRLK